MKRAGRLRLVGLVAAVWLLAACASTSSNTAEPTEPSGTPTATPTLAPVSTTAPKPPPAILIVQGQEQSSGIGTYCWTEPTNGDAAVTLCADMIGIPTTPEPLSAQSPMTVTFELPLSVTPQELLVTVIAVTDQDKQPGQADGWDWWDYLPGERYPLPLNARPALTLSLDPGLYVLDLFARWEAQGDVSYGFLLWVTEGSGTAANVPSPASPIATAPALRFASWSPDNRWVAYWTSSQEDVDGALGHFPAGTLTFADVEMGVSCTVPEFVARDDAVSVHWSDDGAAIVLTAEGGFTGRPCQDDPFAALADYISPGDPVPDSALSPDGRFRAATTIQSRESGLLTFETTLSASDSNQVVQSATWQIDERLGDYGLGGEWVGPAQFLLYETLAGGPLILDAERGVVSVLIELFGLQEIPSILGEEGYNWRAVAASGVAADAFHLLLTGVGLESNYPPAMLYHAESGLVETLPYHHAWWTPLSDDGVWLLMDQRPNVDGYESHAIWMRRVEEVGRTWQPLATGVDAVSWSEDWTEMAFSSREMVTWQTFPDVELVGRWDTGEFWTRPVGWSPDGRFLVTEGNAPGLWQYGLLLLERRSGGLLAP